MKTLILCVLATLALSAPASASARGGVQEDVLGPLVLVKRTIQITESDCMAQLQHASRTSATCNVQFLQEREGDSLVSANQGRLAARVTLGQDIVSIEGFATTVGYSIIFVSANGRDLSPAKAREALRAALRAQLPNGQFVVYVHTVR